jgi:hypothetical protein
MEFNPIAFRHFVRALIIPQKILTHRGKTPKIRVVPLSGCDEGNFSNAIETIIAKVLDPPAVIQHFAQTMTQNEILTER